MWHVLLLWLAVCNNSIETSFFFFYLNNLMLFISYCLYCFSMLALMYYFLCIIILCACDLVWVLNGLFTSLQMSCATEAQSSSIESTTSFWEMELIYKDMQQIYTKCIYMADLGPKAHSFIFELYFVTFGSKPTYLLSYC